MPEKVKANYVDHICIAVNDVKKAEKDYIDAFGWEVAYRYVDEPEKIRVTGFMVGPTAIEVMEDLDGTGEVAKFISRRGEGIARIEGFVVFVPGTKPGDKLKIKITRISRRCANAEAVREGTTQPPEA